MQNFFFNKHRLSICKLAPNVQNRVCNVYLHAPTELPIYIPQLVVGKGPKSETRHKCKDFFTQNRTPAPPPPRSKDLSQVRRLPSSCLVGGGGEWLIAGGDEPYGSELTELHSSLDAPIPGPVLPDGVFRGCQLAINSTHVFLADGWDRYTYIMDWRRGEWMPQARTPYFLITLSSFVVWNLAISPFSGEKKCKSLEFLN